MCANESVCSLLNRLLTSVDVSESPGEASRVTGRPDGVELEHEGRSRTVEHLRDVTEISTEQAGPRCVLGYPATLEM